MSKIKGFNLNGQWVLDGKLYTSLMALFNALSRKHGPHVTIGPEGKDRRPATGISVDVLVDGKVSETVIYDFSKPEKGGPIYLSKRPPYTATDPRHIYAHAGDTMETLKAQYEALPKDSGEEVEILIGLQFELQQVINLLMLCHTVMQDHSECEHENPEDCPFSFAAELFARITECTNEALRVTKQQMEAGNL